MSESSPAFELHGVRVEFDGVAAVAGVDLRIGAHESVALVGPSGAGKTTLLRLLGGTLSPDAGSVEVFGHDLATAGRESLRSLRAGLGFVHQDLALVPNLRVQQNVSAGRLGSRGFWASLRTMTWPSRAELEAVDALLRRVGIEEKLFARTDTLSGGQQQRVAIARALHQLPRALLADEPVSSVDPSRARDTVSLLCSLCEERRIPCVVSLHQLGLAREFFPRLIGVRAGRVVFDRPAAEIGEQEFQLLYELNSDAMSSDERSAAPPCGNADVDAESE